MLRVRRRSVLKTSSVAALSTLAGCSRQKNNLSEHDEPRQLASDALRPDPSGILDLPDDFSYRIVQRKGERLSDGYRAPERPDGMGCFSGPDNTIVLMRNHEGLELASAITPYFPDQKPPAEAYDPEGTGGVTRLVLDADTLALRSSNLVLCGTYWNCAGGLSPWGWLSCEETFRENHGYVFLCRADAERVQSAERIAAYGRMRHEAAAVDPETSIAYLTEDRPDSCFYRFLPKDRQTPFVGSLQALRIVDRPRYDTSELRAGEPRAIDWVTIDDPDPKEDNVRAQAAEKGAAYVRRGEGLWHAGNEVFFSATAGGTLGRGQVLRVTLGDKTTLDVIADANDPDVLDMPDNLCVSPSGLLYIAEDGSDGNFLRRVTRDGNVVAFARNAQSVGEFTGPCFSPDGRSLFVNIQEDGLTLAIRGPFERHLQSSAPTNNPQHTEIDWTRGARGVGGGLLVLALAALDRRRRMRG